MEIKNRSKSHAENLFITKLSILNCPKNKLKNNDQTLSPINLKAKGLKDLKKNKNTILCEINSHYLSCPEKDDHDSDSSFCNLPDKQIDSKITKYSKKVVTQFNDDYLELGIKQSSQTKTSRKLTARILSTSINNSNDLVYKTKTIKFANDCSNLKPTKKYSVEMELSPSDGIRYKEPKKRGSKTSTLCFKQQKIGIDNFNLEEDEEEKESNNNDLKLTRYKTTNLCNRDRSISLILSKLQLLKNGEIKEESSDCDI